MLFTLMAALALLAAACGGAQSTPANSVSGGVIDGLQTDTAQGSSAAGGGGQAGEVEPEPPTPVDSNTIRIGSQVWKRTLPMTTGQCYLFEDDGTLPTSATAWGTLDGDDSYHFSANLTQDGTFKAQVDDNASVYWVAGEGSPKADDLVIEIDFDSQTIKGQGTFYSLTTNKLASGSFEFVCEPESEG
jgi:hypothetical protein